MIIVMVGFAMLGAGEAAASRPGDSDASRSTSGAEGKHCVGWGFARRYLWFLRDITVGGG